MAIEPREMQQRIEELLTARPLVVASIIRIGIPILHERRDPNGSELTLTRGPRITIPPSTQRT